MATFLPGMLLAFSFFLYLFPSNLIGQSPGGNSTGLRLWLKADMGVSGTPSVNGWSDQSPEGNDVTQSSNNRMPQVVNNAINFNPGLQFDGNNDYLERGVGSFTGGVYGRNFYYVGTNNSSGRRAVLYLGEAAAQTGKNISFGGSTNNVAYIYAGLTAGIVAKTHTYGSSPLLNTGRNSGNELNEDYLLSVNSTPLVSGTISSSLSPVTPNINGTQMYIGAKGVSNGTINTNYNGVISEIVFVEGAITDFRSQQIESYLAIKYGITLDQTVATDYVNSHGSSFWTASNNVAYNNDIFGIGRDDNQALNQKVSKSVNSGAVLTVALDNDFLIANDDPTRSTSHINDNQFLVLANNGAAVSSQTTELDLTIFSSRIAREWKVESLNFSQLVNLKFDGMGCDYAILVDSDGDFSSGSSILGGLDNNGEITNVTLNDGDYLTLAIRSDIPNAGIPQNDTTCASSNVYDLTTALSGEDAGGIWYNLTNGTTLSSSIINPQVLGNGGFDYRYIVYSGNCNIDNDTAEFELHIEAVPNAGGAQNDTVCISNTVYDLASNVIGEDIGGTWFNITSGTPLTSSTINPQLLGVGGVVYRYIVYGTRCDNDTTEFELYIEPQPNAGTAQNDTVCSSVSSYDLWNNVNGANSGGVWYDLINGTTLTSTVINPQLLGVGNINYRYVVYGSGCDNDTTEFELNIEAVPNAGVAQNDTICISNTVYDLASNVTGEDIGGTWFNATSGTTLTSSTINPQLLGVGGIVYRYVVYGTRCDNDTTEFELYIESQPNAGIAQNDTVCSSVSSYDLWNNVNGANSGGVWYDLTNGTTLTSTVINPQSLGVGDINYRYVVYGTDCINDTTEFEVHIEAVPNAGIAQNDTTCISNTVYDLAANVTGEDVGGTWFNVTSGTTLTSSTINPQLLGVGGIVYRYVVYGARCDNDTTEFELYIESQPNSGLAQNDTVCSSVSSYDLWNNLSGANSGGTWYDLTNGTILTSTVINPQSLGVGDVNYRYVVYSTDCDNDTVEFELHIEAVPNAGLAQNDTICISNATYNLSSNVIGEDIGGIWYDLTNGVTLSSSIVNPQIMGVGSINYRYVTHGTNCDNDTTEFELYIESQPNAGIAQNDTVCSSVSTYDLWNNLSGANSGGTWYDLTNGTTLTSTVINPQSLGVGDLNYRYVVYGSDCDNDTTEFELNIEAVPNAGVAQNDTVCISNTIYDLAANVIGEDIGGTWFNVTNGTTLTSSTINPQLLGVGGIVYRYVVYGARCDNDTTEFELYIESQPNAGTAQNDTVCSSVSTYDLWNNLSGASSGGTWYDLTNGIILTSTVINPQLLGVGDINYRYVVYGLDCFNDTVEFELHIELGPNAGYAQNDTICTSSISYDLSTSLVGADNGGTWYDVSNGSTLFSSIINPQLQGAGVNNYLYVVHGVNCGTDTTEFELYIESEPIAGFAQNDTVCSSTNVYDLWSNLSGANAGGTWYNLTNGTTLTSSVINPQVLGAGNIEFRYVVFGIKCENDTIEFKLNIEEPPNSGVPQGTSVCNSLTTVDLFDYLNSEDSGGIWDDNGNGGLQGSILSPILLDPGIYTYTYSVHGNYCQSEYSEVNVTIDPVNDAGENVQFEICGVNSPFDLYTLITGNQTGQWWENNYSNTIDGSNFIVENAPLGDSIHYQYLVSGGSCPGDTALISLFICRNEIVVVQGFSPNNDGINDYFSIVGIEDLDNVELSVMNRWGVEVYHSNNYQNNWDGTASQGLSIGNNKLPVGTYYYIIQISENPEPLKGYVFINY